MELRRFKNIFFESLGSDYPETELESFFLLLGEAYLGMNRLQMALSPEKALSAPELKNMEEAQKRLALHEPIQYIIGTTEFYGLPFSVNENVLIPRPETEELVAWILSDLKDLGTDNPKILDIGTGSGCIAIALAKNFPSAEVSAMDISEGALDLARQNAAKNQVEVDFQQQDVLELEELQQHFDVIVSNPPYVRELEKQEMQSNVLDHEPAGALFVKDENPLLFYRKITKLASRALGENGHLYFEINQYLGKETEILVREYGFTTELRKDIFGNFRMLKGER